MVNANLFLAQNLNLEDSIERRPSSTPDRCLTGKWASRGAKPSVMSGRVAVMLSEGNNDMRSKRPTDIRARASEIRNKSSKRPRGFHAIALARKGKTSEALQAFSESLPILLSPRRWR